MIWRVLILPHQFLDHLVRQLLNHLQISGQDESGGRSDYVQAGAGEKTASVEVRVNDFREVNDLLDPPLNSWEQLLTQKGVFPGDNRVDVVVTDDKGNDTRARKKW